MSDERLYEIAGKNIEKWRMQMQHPELYRPIPTGLKELDRYIGGILEGAYYVLGGPHKSAKALSLDTPIMTPNGWSTMGRLQAGEYVFGTDGLAHKIILVTEPMNDHECYNVRFSNGDDIIADAGHLWNVRYLKHKRTKDNQHNKVFVTETMTTAQLSAHAILSHGKLGKLNKYSIRLSSALQSPHTELPLPPYVLGAWLGDGTSADSSITIGNGDEQIIDNIQAAGTPCYKESQQLMYRLGTPGHKGKPELVALTPQSILRHMNVLNDKHIPQIYFQASYEQRLALLQGLMDTDGTIDKKGHCSFTNTNRHLIENVSQLLSMLGIKNNIKESVAKLYGRTIGPVYRITFMAYRYMPVFQLDRKLERMVNKPNNHTRSDYVHIVSVEPTSSIPVKCIMVDSPDHLYLAGKSMIPTHNTTLALQLAMRLASVNRGRVDYFQLEEIKEAMATRALVHGTQHVDRTKIRDLTLGEEDFKDLDKARSMLKNVNLFVEDNEGNAKQICALAKAHKSKFVIVDYLQLMWDNATGQQNESTRLESISRMFIKERNASVNEGNPRTFIIVYQMNEQGKAHGTRTVYKDCDGAIEIVPSEDAEKGEAIEGSIDVHILPGRVWQGGHKISLNFSGAHSLITDGDPILDLKSMSIKNPREPMNIATEELPL